MLRRMNNNNATDKMLTNIVDEVHRELLKQTSSEKLNNLVQSRLQDCITSQSGLLHFCDATLEALVCNLATTVVSQLL